MYHITTGYVFQPCEFSRTSNLTAFVYNTILCILAQLYVSQHLNRQPVHKLCFREVQSARACRMDGGTRRATSHGEPAQRQLTANWGTLLALYCCQHALTSALLHLHEHSSSS